MGTETNVSVYSATRLPFEMADGVQDRPVGISARCQMFDQERLSKVMCLLCSAYAKHSIFRCSGGDHEAGSKG